MQFRVPICFRTVPLLVRTPCRGGKAVWAQIQGQGNIGKTAWINLYRVDHRKDAHPLFFGSELHGNGRIWPVIFVIQISDCQFRKNRRQLLISQLFAGDLQRCELHFIEPRSGSGRNKSVDEMRWSAPFNYQTKQILTKTDCPQYLTISANTEFWISLFYRWRNWLVLNRN